MVVKSQTTYRLHELNSQLCFIFCMVLIPLLHKYYGMCDCITYIATSSTAGNKMPLKAELNAVKKNYMKLMKLPVKDLLPALKVVCV